MQSAQWKLWHQTTSYSIGEYALIARKSALHYLVAALVDYKLLKLNLLCTSEWKINFAWKTRRKWCCSACDNLNNICKTVLLNRRGPNVVSIKNTRRITTRLFVFLIKHARWSWWNKNLDQFYGGRLLINDPLRTALLNFPFFLAGIW